MSKFENYTISAIQKSREKCRKMCTNSIFLFCAFCQFQFLSFGVIIKTRKEKERKLKMTKKEVIAKVNDTRLDESVYVYINGKSFGQDWKFMTVKILEDNLEDDKNYEVYFGCPYSYRVYVAYGKVTVREV